MGLAVLFTAIAFYVGPNVILFGKLTGLTPADFAVSVERVDVPIVRAMKQYERDHGRRPDRAEALAPKYLPEDVAERWRYAVTRGEFRAVALHNHRVFYRFRARPDAGGDSTQPYEDLLYARYPDEGWYVTGPFAEGRIPLPPVAE